MRVLSVLILLAILRIQLIGQMSFSVSTDKSIYGINDQILVSITARNLGSTPDTLMFATGCQADYHIDTLDYMHHDSLTLYCTQAGTQRFIPPNDSTVWDDWLYNFRGTRVGPGKHAVVASLSFLPTGWVSDTLWIVVSTLSSVQSKILIPNQYSLGNNYPNPFNPVTRIEYTLPEQTHVLLTVFNLLGQEVRTLVNETQSPGVKSVDFDAKSLPSGIYFYKLTTAKFTKVKKLVLLK